MAKGVPVEDEYIAKVIAYYEVTRSANKTMKVFKISRSTLTRYTNKVNDDPKIRVMVDRTKKNSKQIELNSHEPLSYEQAIAVTPDATPIAWGTELCLGVTKALNKTLKLVEESQSLRDVTEALRVIGELTITQQILMSEPHDPTVIEGEITSEAEGTD